MIEAQRRPHNAVSLAFIFRRRRCCTSRPIEQPLKSEPGSDRTGTSIEFRPDLEVFKDCEFKYETLQSRIRELAYLNSGLRIQLVDEAAGKECEFHFEDGLKDFCKHIAGGAESLHKEPILINGSDEKYGMSCQIAGPIPAASLSCRSSSK